MPLGSALNSLFLLAQHLDTTKSTVMPVKKTDNDKPFVFPSDEKINYLERDIPENHGFTKEYIDSYFNELNSDLSLRVNRIMVIKDNKVIGERYATPYVKDSWDCVFSFSKTVVALALGLLYDDGKVDLDLPVYKILKNEKYITVPRNKKITLRHLLTMSTGITFNEMETASSLKWTRSFFNSTSKFKLGSKFEYNSLNTYIVSVVVEKLAKKKFADFLQERLFNHMGISKTHFDTSPEGFFKGGWGLYILPEDMAKLGILVKDYGLYNGEQLISKEWIKMMTSKQYPARNFQHALDYGFQIWVDEKSNMCVFNGMYDQNAMIYRSSGVVVITCCSNNEAFHGGHLFPITAKYFAKEKMGDFDLCKTHGNRVIKNNYDLMYYYDLICNKDYKTVTKISNSCGILPLLLQNEIGTYARGIKGINFKKDGTSYALLINENHHIYEIKFDFEDGVRQTLSLYGNEFDVVCDAKFILSGKGEPFLYFKLSFLEFSSIRYFSVKFAKDMDILSLEESENPGFDFVMSIVEVQDEPTRTFIDRTINSINPALVSGTIKNIFAPTFTIVHGEAKIAKFNKSKKKSNKPASKK